jgi:plasmid stability protein
MDVCKTPIRNVPHALDRALRKAARERGRSLNEVVIEALACGAGIAGERGRQRDLGDIAGTWRKDPAFDSVRPAAFARFSAPATRILMRCRS